MEAVGQLTGGIAHDFNNILTVITGTIEILADAVADRPQLAAIAKLIDEAAERGADLTKHLLAFARKQPLQPREVDVNALVLEDREAAASDARRAYRDRVRCWRRTPGRLWSIRSQLTTAILNLALNARDAMPDGGKLVLETNNVYLDEGYAGMHSEVTPGNYVMVAVSDTGTGIPADDCSTGYSIPSSPPRKSARAPASGSAWCSASSSSPAGTSRSTARKATARR